MNKILLAVRNSMKALFIGALTVIGIALTTSPAVAQVAEQELLESYGVGIPDVTVAFGMSAFADHNIYAIGIKNGWLTEVGLSLTPKPFGVRSLSPQVISRFLSGESEIHTWYGPLQIEIMERVPHVKLFTMSDTYVGTYMLAAPNGGAKTVAELVKGGMPFEKAMTTVMQQLKGKRVGIDNTGSSRVFLDAITEIGDLSFDDVDLEVLEDARLVNLARGGNLDFVSPAGAAQNVLLLKEGWYPAVSITDLIENLPLGDPRGIGSIGHTGLATTDVYYRENFDTILRMTGVMFRIIDAINTDLANGTDHALALEVPVIEAAAGVKLGVDGLRAIFTTLDPLMSFEDQADYWVNQDSPHYYWNVYMPQIKAAQNGGLLPSDKDLIPDGAFTAPHVYKTMLRYRTWYDQVVDGAAKLDGERARLAKVAATHYAIRNYLDAYRILNAALN